MLLPTLLLNLACAAPTGETVRAIDLYGNRSLSRAAVIEALGADVGDPSDFDRKAAERRLLALPEVMDAEVVLMSMPGHHSLMVGIVERGTPALDLLEAPDGELRLPEALVATYEETLELSMEGLMAGEAREDVVDGYGLSVYGPARERELALIDSAREQAQLLPRVLRGSSDARHRAVAASCLAYLEDKALVQAHLGPAMRDPDSGVRNNATRALLVLADWANGEEGFALEIDWGPVLEMLESARWTDRNKASGLLLHLSEGRDTRLLADLREGSVPALAEMARWSLDGYSYGAWMVLGRLTGRADEELKAARGLEGPEREAWIGARVEELTGAG